MRSHVVVAKDMRDMQLIEKLRSKRAVIGIVGLGYVGLPLALRFCEVGYKVIGLDIDPTKIDILARGESYIEHIEPQRIANVIGLYFEPTSDFAQASCVDALILCVPTPLNKYREPDLSFVVGTLESLLPFLHPGMIV